VWAVQTIVVLFNLKSGVSVEAYEAWARTTDLPIVNALASVDRFEVLRTTGLLGGGSSPYQYVELLRVASLDALFADIGTDTMRRVAAEFQAFADQPLFITTSAL
jgi:hypothetical protein